MPNYYLSVLYKHIIQVENKNVGLKVGGHKHTFAPPIKKVGGGTCPPCRPASYASAYYKLISLSQLYWAVVLLQRECRSVKIYSHPNPIPYVFVVNERAD